MEAPTRSFRSSGFSGPTRLIFTVRGFFAVLGIALLAALAAPGTREGVVAENRLPPEEPGLRSPEDRRAEPVSRSVEVVQPKAEREQRAVVEFIAKRYRVAEEAIASFVSSAYRAGAEYRVDPLLILAVVAIESRFNPVAESFLGAKGLMQVLPKYHRDRLLEHGGEPALLDPDVNIRVGTQILQEYLHRFGEAEAALQMYGGVSDDPTSQYVSKVLAMRARLAQLIARARRSAV